jgi:hypothetical protein
MVLLMMLMGLMVEIYRKSKHNFDKIMIMRVNGDFFGAKNWKVEKYIPESFPSKTHSI